MNFVSIVGNRPQFIKLAAIQRELERRELTESHTIIHTGQHYDDNMSKVFFDELDIPKPNFNLGIHSTTHGKMTGMMLSLVEFTLMGLSGICKPNFVIVYGDTNSTLAGALAAVKLNIPVVHIEAGLRSYNRRMPEEINRVLVDQMSDVLFCPSRQSRQNIYNENSGHHPNVHVVGDVMYDAFLHYTSENRLEWTQKRLPKELFSYFRDTSEYYLATVHRVVNIDDHDRLDIIFSQLEALAIKETVIVPIHPRLKKALRDLPDESKIAFIPPVSYLEMLSLERNARIIITDSGGVQKEAYWSKVPCITLRDETEWPETLDHDANKLVDVTEGDSIVKRVSYLETSLLLGWDSWPGQPYGDGTAAKQIIDILLEKYGK